VTSNTKSPLREDPLRLPGQSVDEQIQDLIRNRISERIVFVAMVLLLTLMEWIRWLFEIAVSPYLYTILFVLSVAITTPQLVSARRRLRNLRLGRDGERAVGQTLERLRRHGYHVFHDIVGAGWNVDHVLIGPGGIFTVETKTFSKPRKGRATITYNRFGLHHEHGFDMSDCLVQAKAQARFLNYLLGEETGKSLPVQPVVVFPGWYIDTDGTESREVWVLEPKAFLKWIRNRKEILTAEQIRLARRVVSKASRRSYSSGSSQALPAAG
jgi:hypothetical protein